MSQLFEVQYIYRYCWAKRKKTNEVEEEHKEETWSLLDQVSGEYDWMSLVSAFSWFEDGTPEQ